MTGDRIWVTIPIGILEASVARVERTTQDLQT